LINYEASANMSIAKGFADFVAAKPWTRKRDLEICVPARLEDNKTHVQSATNPRVVPSVKVEAIHIEQDN
jgi:hypothetical protein